MLTSHRRCSNNQFSIQEHLAAWLDIVNNPIEQHLAGLVSHVFKRYPNRRQRRVHKPRQRIIVEPDDGDLIRNGLATLVDGRERAERDHIACDQYGRRGTWRVEQAHGGGEATIRAEITITYQGFVEGNASLYERILVSEESFSYTGEGQWAVGDQSDPRVSLG